MYFTEHEQHKSAKCSQPCGYIQIESYCCLDILASQQGQVIPWSNSQSNAGRNYSHKSKCKHCRLLLAFSSPTLLFDHLICSKQQQSDFFSSVIHRIIGNVYWTLQSCLFNTHSIHLQLGASIFFTSLASGLMHLPPADYTRSVATPDILLRQVILDYYTG